MSEQRPILLAKWTDDCQGKKSYDGAILVISSRYWPPDGGFMTFDTATGKMDDKPIKGGKHTATCSLDLIDAENDDEYGDRMSLIEQDFEADTFDKLKADVEAFAQKQMDKAVKAIEDAFYVDPNGSPN